MNTKKRNKLWFMDKEELQKVVSSSESLAEVCRKLDYAKNGAQYKVVKRVLAERQIDFSHISLGLGSNKGHARGGIKPKSLKEVMVKNSTYDSRWLKSRLLKEGILKEECRKCGLGPKWQNEPLTLHLEHINGNHYDNRLENLEILCPNCHTQTKTWGSKKR